MKTSLTLACVVVTAALLAGCQTRTDGTPATPESETTASEPANTPSTSSTTVPSPTTTAPTPAEPQVLQPDDSGYVFIQTKSGQTRCQLNEESVGCEAPFTNSPMQDGERANGVNLSPDGSLRWIVGNLGDIPAVTIDYRSYTAVGWTIDATTDGTRFTNQRTQHGMFVSIEKVDSF